MRNTKQKQKNLFEMLSELSDQRRAQGRMHDLRFILIVVIMATMSGFFSLRAIGDFIQKNKKELLKTFKPNKDRLPSHQTIGRTLQNIDFDELNNTFHTWANMQVKITKNEWVSIDGKAIKGTVSDYSKAQQRFISLVTIFSSKQKQILLAGKINNKKESEIPGNSLKKMIDSLRNGILLDVIGYNRNVQK